MSKSIATGLVAVAAVSSALAFGGWLFDVPALRHFGLPRYPIWPLTALGYLALSLGYLAWIRALPRLASLLWAVPVAIAFASLVQSLAGVELGTDKLLFGDMLAAHAGPRPGRPGSNPTAILLLLAAAGYATRARAWVSRRGGGLLGRLALAFIGAAALLILASAPGGTSGFLSISVPGAVAAACLATAFVVLHGDPAWIRLLNGGRADWQTVRTLVPAALVLPLIPSAIELALLRNELLSETAGRLLVVSCNMFIVASIAFWAVARVAREQATMIELTQALDATTVVLTTPDGRITHWSRGCEELYGWSAAEARGQFKYALLRSRCQTIGASLPVHGEEEGQELVELCRDGREVAILERVHHVSVPGRTPVTVLKMTDISKRVATMEALRASEERLGLATSAHELGIFEWDVPTGRLDWSPGTEQRLGVIPGSMTDFDGWRAQVEPEDVQDILATIARAVQDRTNRFVFRYRFLQPNGGVRAVEGSSRAFYDSEGNLLRTVGVILDVTEREEREAALRGREAQLRSILETVPDAMIVIDQLGTVLEFSPAAEALWGYRPADVVGHSFLMLAASSQRDRYSQILECFLETGEGIIGEVIPGIAEAADGRCFPIESRTGVAANDGSFLLTIFVRDLSERAANEARLADLHAEIAHVSRQSAMNELAADLAHELNQPLSATSNFLAAARILLGKGEPPERIDDLLRMGSEQTLRAGEIIRRMRAFMARGEIEMHAESVERTLRDACELVLVGTAQFRIRIAYDLDPASPFVFADRIQVQQVIVNLLRNAMEALRNCDCNAPQIVISSRKLPDQMVELAVTDNGPGIPAQILENLFSRFTTTKGAGGGMGIGLSISKRIIEAHGGTLRAESGPGGGASFRFTLPSIEQGGER